MNILGINDSHNASACLVIDGKLVAAGQEERFTRVKNSAGFPLQAVAWLLQWAGMSPADIDHVAFHSKVISPLRVLRDIGHALRWADKPLVPSLWQMLSIGDIYPHRFPQQIQHRRLHHAQKLGLTTEHVSFVEHHSAHAATALYGHKFSDSGRFLILTCDGSGDRLCATVNMAEQGKVRRIAAVPHSESVGLLYSAVTLLLGMRPSEDEYKVMGLAPYAPPPQANELARRLLRLFEFDQPHGMTWKRMKGLPDWRVGLRFLKRFLDGQRFDVVAGGLQQFLEEWLRTWVRNSIRATGVHRVAVAGGVFMNVKANQAIAMLPEVDEFFVFPSCGDESGAIGAAWVAYNQLTQCFPESLRDLYLGPEYTDAQICSAIDVVKEPGWSVEFAEDAEHTAAKLLSDGHIVGRFDGRAEFGARALGHRSVLADASKPAQIKTLNEQIKRRDFWMPFAPSILDSFSSVYLVNAKRLSAPYMTLTFDTTDRREELAAAIHPYDLTTRPQVVSRSQSPRYYRLLEEFEAITGRGGILNTSFNLHGEPIVCSPEDALRTFQRSGLTHLVMGKFVVRKQTG